jgi:hypothetical protein
MDIQDNSAEYITHLVGNDPSLLVNEKTFAEN